LCECWHPVAGMHVRARVCVCVYWSSCCNGCAAGILFLDEPTSGLDSVSAFQVCACSVGALQLVPAVWVHCSVGARVCLYTSDAEAQCAGCGAWLTLSPSACTPVLPRLSKWCRGLHTPKTSVRVGVCLWDGCRCGCCCGWGAGAGSQFSVSMSEMCVCALTCMQGTA